MKRTLITSALPYANGHIHLGHCAGAYLPADIYARFLRLSGEEVLYVCGSDEHGVAITIAAEQENVTPKEIIDKYHEANYKAFREFGMTFDVYSRTSLPIHHETAKEFFKDFLDKGLLTEKEELQFYDEQANMFLPDRYVEGICPNCGADGARGDQCDNCGAYYNQTDLKEPKSRVTGNKPVERKTTHWYLKLGEFQDFLEKYIDSHSRDWKDNVLQQTRSWLKQGLTERAITRDLTWGVKIDDVEGIPLEKAEGKVLYVWFEAVLGYISATKDFMRQLGRPEKEWKKWWQDDGTRYIAFIGKDNIVFHTLIFPALLNAKGGYILPENVPANEFLNLEGRKFSKSRNWSIDLRDFINDFPDKKDVDTLRYSLAMAFPETRDSDYTWKDFQWRNNNELAAIPGNFVNRTLQFIQKNFDGKVPACMGKYCNFSDNWRGLIEIFEMHGGEVDNFLREIDEEQKQMVLSDNDIELLWALWQGTKKIDLNYRRFRFRDAINETMNVARAANKYFNDEEPWKTAKNNPDKCSKTLFVCAQVVRSLATLLAPIIPYSSEKIYKMLNLEPQTGAASRDNKTDDLWHEVVFPTMPEKHQLGKPEILFTKVEDSVVEEQQAKLGTPEETRTKEAEEFEQIGIEDFAKVKLRTAKVISAEKIKKSKKLLKVQVDLGWEQRRVIAGIAEHYKPEDLIGKTVILVANLKPAKLMGHESQGMILAASDKSQLSILTPDKDIGPGEEIS